MKEKKPHENLKVVGTAMSKHGNRRFKVQSSRDHRKEHVVIFLTNAMPGASPVRNPHWLCSCEHFTFQRASAPQRKPCWHLRTFKAHEFEIEELARKVERGPVELPYVEAEGN